MEATKETKETAKKDKAPEVPKKKKEHETMPKPEVKVVEGQPGDEKKKRTVNAAVEYSLKREPTAEDKLPPQCKQIVDILAAAPDKKLNRETLLAEMTKVVKTRQPMERILGYYQPRLISKGLVIMSQNVKVLAQADAAGKAEAVPKTPGI
jgi:hypothetical protein